MRSTKLIQSVVIGAVAGLVLSSAAVAGVQQDVAATSVLEEIKKRGVLKVGMATFVPWAMASAAST